MYIDTHAHIYKNVKKINNSAVKNNVNAIFNCAEDIATSKKVIEIFKKYNNLYAVIGIHPLNVDSAKINDLEILEKLIQSNYIVAIGEIGLDYFYSKKNRERQILFFEYQLKLAKKYNLPVIIHSRNSTDDIIKILKKYHLKGIIHCFSGSIETANIFVNLGFYLGIGGIVTFKNCNLKDTLKNISINNIVLETDSPFLSPEPYRGKINEPKNIPVISKKIAEIYNFDDAKVENKTTANVLRIFDI